MVLSKSQLTERLLATARALPDDKLAELLDFADSLRSKVGPSQPPRGSAEAILQALDKVGPLQFDPGELEALLEDIERSRDSPE